MSEAALSSIVEYHHHHHHRHHQLYSWYHAEKKVFLKGPLLSEIFRHLKFAVEPWPNECNITIQHRSTLLNATC